MWISDKNSGLSIIWDKCVGNDENIFKEVSIEILKIIVSINNMSNMLQPNEYIITLRKNTAEENISQKFRLKNIDEARNYFIEEINKSELMSMNKDVMKHKNVYTALNYFEYIF